MTLLKISLIRRDGGTQPREKLNEEVVSEYASAMARGDTFPAISVTYDGTAYWLVDGFHRVRAAKTAGKTEIIANVIQGTLEEAQWESFAVNTGHGLQRTNADKERAIKRALKHPSGLGKSDREIADHVRVDHKTVSRWRRELEMTGEIPQSEKRVGADGRTINVANIGHTPKPSPVRYTRSSDIDPPPADDTPSVQVDSDPAPDERTERKWDPGIRVMCTDCGEAHADWIPLNGSRWSCRRCGVIRNGDSMEEWEPAPKLPVTSHVVRSEPPHDLEFYKAAKRFEINGKMYSLLVELEAQYPAFRRYDLLQIMAAWVENARGLLLQQLNGIDVDATESSAS